LSKEKSEISDLMKVSIVGAELFHADGRTDMTKLIVKVKGKVITLQDRCGPEGG